MRHFFKNVFASFLGSVVFAILVFFVVYFAVSNFMNDGDDVIVQRNTILEIEFKGSIVERSSNNPLDLISVNNISNHPMQIKDILDNIEKAKNDDRIKGIYLKYSSIDAGFAQIEEIRNKLLEFKEEGKFIITYSNDLSQKAYYLATVSDKIYLSPAGKIELKGLSASVKFYKDLLDKLGIDVQILRHGKFKSAVEPFISNGMSQSNRKQLSKLEHSISNNMINNISNQRKIKNSLIHKTIDRLDLNISDKCYSLGFVDGVSYEDEVKKEIDKNYLKDAKFISLKDYMEVNDPEQKISTKKIAIIYANGTINVGESDYNNIGSETIVKAFRAACNNIHVKAIVLRVNSPGGSALASDIIWREVAIAKKKKPVVVSMGDYAASGGYYIACNANKILASPSTITGSIGVFGIVLNLQNLLNNKIGIYIDTVNTHKYSDIGNPARPLTDYETQVIQESIESIYQRFINNVAEGRKMKVSDVDSIAQGRVWSGKDALELGLIDELGGIERSIEVAADLASLEDYTILDLPRKKDPIDILVDKFLMQNEIVLANFLGVGDDVIREVKSILNSEGINARIPFLLEIN